MITKIKDVLQGKAPMAANRSPHWSTTRKNHLKNEDKCVVCGSVDKLNVHHIKPFHLHPELELEPSNLITLCESNHHGVNCHLLFGHLGNFKNINPNVLEDTTIWNAKLKEDHTKVVET